MPINSETNPLVTFAILTFNQEKYITDAINSALLQEYSKLEIIISDDGSSDKTVEIAKKIIKTYKGPHTIRINQTKENLCILGHFFEVLDLASGRLIILAAGDDVSIPSRTKITVNTWLTEKSHALFSNYQLIDKNSNLLLNKYSPNSRSSLAEDVFNEVGGVDIHGASSAYDVDFARSLPRPEGRFFHEDTFMTFMMYFFDKKISKIEAPLVRYRTHSASLSNQNSSADTLKNIIANQKKAAFYSLSKYNLYEAMIHELGHHFVTTQKENLKKSLKKHIEKHEMKGIWIECGTRARIQSLYKFRGDQDFAKWLLPRVFGLKSFALIKLILKYIKT